MRPESSNSIFTHCCSVALSQLSRQSAWCHVPCGRGQQQVLLHQASSNTCLCSHAYPHNHKTPAGALRSGCPTPPAPAHPVQPPRQVGPQRHPLQGGMRSYDAVRGQRRERRTALVHVPHVGRRRWSYGHVGLGAAGSSCSCCYSVTGELAIAIVTGTAPRCVLQVQLLDVCLCVLVHALPTC